MGAEPYEYTVPFESDIQSALDKLRAKAFESGEFDGAEFGPATPDEALEAAAEEGTRSILDIMQVSDNPDFCRAAPFSDEELQTYFGTNKPTAADVQVPGDYFEEIERGHCRYVILYEGDEPSQIYFAGYSFD